MQKPSKKPEPAKDQEPKDFDDVLKKMLNTPRKKRELPKKPGG
jgi:hypothetical protein